MHVQPSAAVRALRVRGMQMLGDMTAAAQVYEIAREDGRRAAQQLRADFPHIVEPSAS